MRHEDDAWSQPQEDDPFAPDPPQDDGDRAEVRRAMFRARVVQEFRREVKP